VCMSMREARPGKKVENGVRYAIKVVQKNGDEGYLRDGIPETGSLILPHFLIVELCPKHFRMRRTQLVAEKKP